MTKNLVITHSASITPRQVLAERITILADHSQTGSYEVTLHDGLEGAGPPPHFHPWDEAFYVIDGEVDFDCGGVSKKIVAGGFIHVPGGMVHAFRYATPTAQMVGITSGEGSATMFTAVDRECGAAPDMEKLVAVLNRHKLELANQAG
jgi:quercetin dioxygenase-like cupin family protein